MRRNWLLILCLTGCLLGAAGIWHLCTGSDSTAFLTAHAGAEWIVDDMPVIIDVHPATAVTTVFKKTFTCGTDTGDSRLEVRAFKSEAVSINGQPILLEGDPRHWKAVQTALVGGQLHPGTNEIVVSVTNNFGPAALWLRLQMPGASLITDASWLSSPIGSHWLPARPATQMLSSTQWCPLNNDVRADMALRRIWMPLALVVIAAFVLVMLATKYLSRQAATPEKYIWLLLFIALTLRTVAWVNDITLLSPTAGFDTKEHLEYIHFIQQRHQLPLPNDGWEMHQPPLYYLVCTLWLGVLGLDVDAPGAFVPLHAVNGVIGLAQCVLTLLCLRRLFPGNLSAQAVGLLITVFLPPNLYLSLYMTNDTLAGLLVSAALYFFLRWREQCDSKFAVGVGLAMGAAVLTKLNSILAVPVLLVAMGVEISMQGKISTRKIFSGPALALLLCVLTCSWHYLRAWHQIGALPLPNSQTNDASAWWQQPAYRTAGYYLGFGQSLVSPLYSGLNSFADGIYSTLWADGLTGGTSDQVFRPPWYYDWMAVAGLLAAPLTILAVVGLFELGRRLFLRPDASSLVLTGLPLIFGAGIFYLTLRGPWLAHVKAFYALPALVPFCALIAGGWTRLPQRNRWLQHASWTFVLVWCFVTLHAFWLGFGNFELLRSRTIDNLRQHDTRDALANSARAIQLNPADAESHSVAGEAWDHAGQPEYACQEYAKALSLRPDSPYTLEAAALVLTYEQKGKTAQAVKLAERACELTGYRQASFVTTLAQTYAKNGQPAEAGEAAVIAWQLALQTGNAALLKQNWEFLNQLMESQKTH
jgi:Tfp pilus assembly protein PilF/4-amino-4-deoxy-L-arabinose transferase-like glycosyltransferase